jgi:energy-coupling factor transporter ATP-binding protein EcfA2
MIHDVMPKNKGQEVVFNLATKRGKPNLDIMIKVGEGKFEDVNSGRGGSVSNVLSTGLRYVTLSRTKNRRFMILDEPDCWLEDQAVPRFAKVVSDISRKVGIQTIAISHKNPEFYNSRMIELYRDDNDVVKAKVIQESKDDSYIDSDEYEDINRTSFMDDVGIRRIKIKNYMSLTDINVELSPTMNMIVGENDIGKSAFFSAIRSFVENDCNETMIQHGKDMFSIEMEIEDGIVLRLEHKRKGQKKTTYQMIMPDGETISEDNGRDVPDFIEEALAIKSIDGINIQLGHQKTPVFMIGPDVTSSKRAELLSLGRESDYIQKMINIYARELKDDALIIKNGQRDIENIRVQIESLEPVFDLETRYSKVESFLDHYHVLQNREATLSSITKELEANKPVLDNAKNIRSLVLPVSNLDVSNFNLVDDIIKTGMRIKKDNDIITKLSNIKNITIPTVPEINSNDSIISPYIEDISVGSSRVTDGRKKIEIATQELLEISKEKETFIKDIGGVCPLCQNHINEHKKENV